jgi:hypothetical protein
MLQRMDGEIGYTEVVLNTKIKTVKHQTSEGNMRTCNLSEDHEDWSHWGVKFLNQV